MPYQSIFPEGGNGSPQLDRILGGKANPYAGGFHPGQYAGEVGPQAGPVPGPTKPQGPTGFWGRIAQVGQGMVAAIHLAAEVPARMFPGGNNDLKAQQQSSAQDSKNLNLYHSLYKSGKITGAQYQKLTGAAAQQSSQTAQDVTTFNHGLTRQGEARATVQGAKDFANGMISSERTAATGIARVLPGGTNDLKASANQADSANKTIAQIKAMQRSGQISSDQANRIIQSQAEGSSQASQDVTATEKAMPTKKELAAGFAGTALDVIAGGSGVARQGAKYTLEKGLQKTASGKLVGSLADSAKIGSKAGRTAAKVATGAAAGATNAQATGASTGDTIKQALLGAGLVLAPHIAQSAASSFKTALTKGPRAALADLKATKPTPTSDVMTTDQADHIAQHGTMGKTASVADASSGATAVPVRQPKLLQKGAIGELPAGSKTGSTMNLSTKTIPESQKTVPVSDEEYVRRSTDIAKSHDQQVKAALQDLKKAPAIEGYHTSDQLVKDHAAHLQSLDSGLKGGQMQKMTDGTYTRTTEHTPFYSKYYAEHGRAPSKAAYLAEAQHELESGKASHGASDVYAQLKQRETAAVQKVYNTHQAMHAQLDHEYMNGKPNPDYQPAKTTQTGFVRGDKAAKTTTPVATAAQRRIAQIDTIISKAQKQGTTKSATQMRALMQERRRLQDVAEGKTVPKTAPKPSQTDRFKAAAQKGKTTEKPAKTPQATSEKSPGKSPEKAPAQAASANEIVAETSAPISRPKAAGKPVEREPLVNNNKSPSKGLNKLVASAADRIRSGGKLNPVIDAARRGHTAFSDLARSVAGKKVYSLRHGNLLADKFDTAYSDYLAKGGSHEQFIKDIENGTGNSEAHQLWRQIHKDTGAQMLKHGVTDAVRNETYVGRVGQFPGKGYVRGGTGLKKSGGFSKGRIQGAVDEFGNSHDMFKTHADYKAFVEKNGGKVLSDPRQILRHTLPSKLEAIENAKGLNGLEKTAMADGRPAVISVGSKGAPHEFNDYVPVQGLNGRMVHPDATPVMKALTHVYSAEELNNPLAKANSMAKKLVTLNGLVHGKNFALASIRKQGVIRTAHAVLTANKNLSARFGEANIQRAVEKGGVVPFEQSQQDMFDKIKSGDTKPSLIQRVFKHGEVPFDTAHSKMNDALFNKLGNHLQLSAYFHAEKQFIKQGLSADEAAKAAGQVAKNVSFISSSVESSAEYRKTSRLVAFAGQYLKSTMHEAGTAAGLVKDNALSKAAQSAVQKEAIKGAIRGTTYLMGMAQLLNYATTGHSTFQNKGSKISPVFYVDKNTGKEYHLTNWYGQIGDIMHMTNPQGWINKTSPGLQEIVRVMGNHDSFTGAQIRDPNASGVRQIGQILGNTIENLFTPAGFGASNFGKTFGKSADPAPVTLARLMGYGASTQAQNNLEKDISTSYYNSLPQKATSTSPQLSKLEAAARHDIAKGNKDSANVQALKGKMSDAAYKAFVKTGGLNQTQYQFDKLSSADKLKIVQKYSPQQLKELDLSGLVKTVSSNKRSQQTLTRKDGYTSQQLQTLLDKARKSQ